LPHVIPEMLRVVVRSARRGDEPDRPRRHLVEPDEVRVDRIAEAELAAPEERQPPVAGDAEVIHNVLRSFRSETSPPTPLLPGLRPADSLPPGEGRHHPPLGCT